MAEVSGAGGAAVLGCSFNEIKSPGGVPLGVVDCIATERTVYQMSLVSFFHTYMLEKRKATFGSWGTLPFADGALNFSLKLDSI